MYAKVYHNIYILNITSYTESKSNLINHHTKPGKQFEAKI